MYIFSLQWLWYKTWVLFGYSHVQAFLNERVGDVWSHVILDNDRITSCQDMGRFDRYVIQHKGTDHRIYCTRTELLQIVYSYKTKIKKMRVFHMILLHLLLTKMLWRRYIFFPLPNFTAIPRSHLTSSP